MSAQASDSPVWQVFTDSTVFREMLPFDIVLKNGVTLYNQHYNAVDWTAVRDWRYAAPLPAVPAPTNEPLVMLTLGGIDAGEYGDNDIEIISSNRLEALQRKLVTTSENVYIELYASQPVAALPAEQVPTDGEKFMAHLQWASDEVATWPAWKRPAPAEQAVELPPLPLGLHRLETVQYWAAEFAKDPQRLAGSMIVQLLKEYAELRAALAARQAPTDQTEMLREVIRTMRNYPDFDADNHPFSVMMDEALAGKTPALLGTIDSLANGQAPARPVVDGAVDRDAQPFGWIIVNDATGEHDGGEVMTDKEEADDYMENRCLPRWHLEALYRQEKAK